MQHAPPRYPIEIVRRLAPPAPVRLGGRVIHVDGQRATIADVTGALSVESALPPPASGSWVVAHGNWNGNLVEEATYKLLNVPRIAFPPPDGEWRRFQDDGARRIQILRNRAALLRGVREFFDQRAFIEVETPLAVPSPGLDLHLDAFEVQGFPDPRWLITSPEYQMKRLLAGGLPRIFQTTRCFRNNELGHIHAPEFTMVEWYRAFAGASEVMRDTEDLVAHLAGLVHQGSSIIPARGTPVDTSPPWPRITVREAFEKYAGADVDAILPDEEQFFRVLVEQVEPQLGHLRPVFVTDWPASMASLARINPRDPTVADRFEAYVAGIEVCNGFGELIDPVEQQTRLKADQDKRRALGKPVYPIDPRFIAALEEGIPPSGGNALGFDRLVMLILGVQDIRDVLAIPPDRS